MLPELGGTSEVAEVLGCRKTQLYSLRQRDDFPVPLLVLAATPVWSLEDIRAFKDSWKRRSHGLTA